MADHDPHLESATPPGSSSGEAPEHLDPPAAQNRSLTDDLIALIDDGKTYLETEVQFQKTRAAFTFDRGRSGALYALVALMLVWLALVALVVGLVIALTPVIGPWAATAVVVVLLIAGAAFFGWRAKQRFARLGAAYRDTRR